MKKRDKITATGSTIGPATSTTSSRSTELTDGRFLEVFAKHRHIWNLYQVSRELVNFHHHIQAELLVAYRALVDPFYHYNNNCRECVQEFITRCYTWYDNQPK
jgi:hypothetical protein